VQQYLIHEQANISSRNVIGGVLGVKIFQLKERLLDML
jgi:hypothetical protein